MSDITQVSWESFFNTNLKILAETSNKELSSQQLQKSSDRILDLLHKDIEIQTKFNIYCKEHGLHRLEWQGLLTKPRAIFSFLSLVNSWKNYMRALVPQMTEFIYTENSSTLNTQPNDPLKFHTSFELSIAQFSDITANMSNILGYSKDEFNMNTLLGLDRRQSPILIPQHIDHVIRYGTIIFSMCTSLPISINTDQFHYSTASAIRNKNGVLFRADRRSVGFGFAKNGNFTHVLEEWYCRRIETEFPVEWHVKLIDTNGLDLTEHLYRAYYALNCYYLRKLYSIDFSVLDSLILSKIFSKSHQLVPRWSISSFIETSWNDSEIFDIFKANSNQKISKEYILDVIQINMLEALIKRTQNDQNLKTYININLDKLKQSNFRTMLDEVDLEAMGIEKKTSQALHYYLCDGLVNIYEAFDKKLRRTIKKYYSNFELETDSSTISSEIKIEFVTKFGLTLRNPFSR